MVGNPQLTPLCYCGMFGFQLGYERGHRGSQAVASGLCRLMLGVNTTVIAATFCQNSL